MDEIIMVAGTAIVSFAVGVGSMAITTIKGWWLGKTPKAQKKFIEVMGKALVDGKISIKEYNEIFDEI